MHDSNHALQLVKFGDDQLQATRQGETVWVSVPAVAAAIGVDPEGQRQRLARSPWATTCVMQAVAEDNKVRDITCLALDSLPMWLATLDSSRIKTEARRAKIIRYQRECAKVLREHFFGATKPLSSIQLLLIQVQAMAELEQRTAAHEEQTKALATKVEVLSNHIEQDVGYCVVSARNDRHNLTDVQLHTVGKIATRLCLEQGLRKREVQGTRYPIGCYPIHVVDQAFKAYLMGAKK